MPPSSPSRTSRLPSRLRTTTLRTTLLPDGPATSNRTRAGRWVARTTKAAAPSTAATGRTSTSRAAGTATAPRPARRATPVGWSAVPPAGAGAGCAPSGPRLAIDSEAARTRAAPTASRAAVARQDDPAGPVGDRAIGGGGGPRGTARAGGAAAGEAPRTRAGERCGVRDGDGDGHGGGRRDRHSDRRGLDERHERGRRHDPELGADDLAVALELAHRPGPVVTSEEGADEQLARRLPQRLEAGHGAGGVLREHGVASLERPAGEALERTDPLALEVVALLLDPRVVPAGEQLVPRQRDEQRPRRRSRVGHGRPERVDVDHHVGREPDAGPVGGEQPGAPLVGLCHRPSEAGQRTRVGAVRPQRAGDLCAGPRAAEREQGAQPLLAAAERDDVAVHDELPLAEEAQATASGDLVARLVSRMVDHRDIPLPSTAPRR